MLDLKSIANTFVTFSLIFGIGFSSCKRHRTKTQAKADTLIVNVIPPTIITDTTATSPKTTSVDEDVDNIKIDEIDFKYFTESQNAQINFRIKKDSLIWFSISGFGIEAVRGIITQDSLFAIDKLHREYVKFDFLTLSNNFNFDLNFEIMQSLVLGNLPIKKKGKNKFVKRENDYYLLHQQDGKVLIDNYIGDGNRKLKKLELTKTEEAQNKLTMTFDDFQKINEHVFPYESLITVGYQSEKDKKFYETLIELKHKKVEFTQTPLGFPFSIPSNYSPKK
jgi:hypothetical protein